MARALFHINGNPILLHVPCRPNLSRSCPLRLPYRPLKVTMSCNQSYWTSINTDIETYLKQAIPIREPLSVFEPMHRLTLAAPRNTAPALCVAACELVGGHRDQALAAASALHLMYAASYTHEHLPLTKSSRPAKSTIQHVYGPNVELMIGDAMIPFGLELLARADDPAQNNSDRVLRVMVEITRATGSQGMVYGQYYEVEQLSQSDNKQLGHLKEIEHVCEKCEGVLHACAAACGAILGGGSEEEIEKLRRYGLYIGKIQGMMNRVGNKDKDVKNLVEEIRNLANKELRGFNEAKVEAISSSFESNLMYV
ncbi:hypothetical protein PTKIN_Ptkin14bG0041100 [Pterospermum kingtungense]